MKRRPRQSGFMLLEVVVAVGLLVLGLAVIGAQLQSATEMTYESDHLSRLIFLTESKLAELDSGLVALPEQMDDAQSIEVEADFGRYFPQYASRVTIEPTADPDLVAVQLDILYDPQRVIAEEGEDLPEFDYDDDDKIVQTYHTLRIVPRPLNLVTDFGLEADIAEQVNQDLQDAGLADGGLDVENFNPAAFKDLDVDQLLQLLSILQQAYGVDQSALMQMVPEEVRPQLQALLEGLNDGADAAGNGDAGTNGAGTATGGGNRGAGRRGGDSGRAGRENRRGGRDDGRSDGMNSGGAGRPDDGSATDGETDAGAPARRGGGEGSRRGGSRRGGGR